MREGVRKIRNFFRTIKRISKKIYPHSLSFPKLLKGRGLNLVLLGRENEYSDTK